ncbi:MAG: hemolysin III family protein [Chloroflexota bacterium]|jgi:hemolysin III
MPKKMSVAYYSLKEEIVNSVTHGVGALLSVAGLIVLLAMAVTYGDVWRIVSLSIYGTSLFVLYLASTLYHMIQHRRAKRVLRICDHAAIYLLIAGTYTPFLLVVLNGVLGWVLFAIIWGLAGLGIIYKVFFLDRHVVAETVGYLLMGWLCVVALPQLVPLLSPQALWGLILGGIVYSLGVIFYARPQIAYSHGVWHLFVLGGSALHYFAVVDSVFLSAYSG